MKISSISTFSRGVNTNLQQVSNPIANRYQVSFAGDENDVFEKNDISYIAKVEKALNSLQKLQTNKIDEIKTKLDELGFDKVSLVPPKKETEYKNGKLFRETEADSPAMITQIQYNDEGKEEFLIMSNKLFGNNLLRITKIDEDGSEGSTIAYENGKIDSCKIYLKDGETYQYMADANKHGIITPGSKHDIIFSRFIIDEDPYNYSRIEHSVKQNGLNGQLFISKENDEVWWFDHSGENNEEVTFKKEELKEYDMDSAFDEVNSLLKKIVPSEARTEEINTYYNAVFELA